MKRDCMKKERMDARAWRAVVAGLALAGSVSAGAGLEQGFRAPPRTAKPHTWFHMMNGNVTKEGLTRDFEELARAGIGGVQMFDAGCDIPPGGLDFNSPEWFETFRHAASEARRLGLEICIPNCSGWSSSGGPWNPPSNGMKRVTFRQTSATGPAKFRAKLPRETDDHGFYADIGVFAFPTPTAEKASFDGVAVKVEPDAFSFTSGKPFAATGFSYRLDYRAWRGDAEMAVEISEDGASFRPFETFRVPLARSGARDNTLRFHAFPQRTTMRALRAKVVRADVKATLVEARPEQRMRLSNLAAKTFALRQEAPCDTTPTTPDQVVATGAVRDLTGLLQADGTLVWDVPAGDWTILRVGYACNGRRNHPASDHGLGLEVDKLSAEALDYHFEQYVARLCRTLGPLAGKVATGFNNILVDSYEVGSQNWTQRMEAEFERRRGYSLRPFMPAFAGYVLGDVPTTERFLEDFRRVVADLFAENYAGALARKCHEYGLLCSVEPYGNCPADNLQYGQHCDIPMGEFWSDAGNPYGTDCGNAKFVSSVAHVWGRPYCGAEAFTAAPGARTGRWLTTPFSIKAQGDSAFASGVNRIIYHRFTHQPWADDKYLPGMTMGRWGMHLDRTQTWWEFAKPWFAYQTRCQYMLQKGTFCADVLFFAGEEAPNQGGNTNGGNTRPPFFNVPDGYDSDVCPTDALRRLKVEDGRVVVPGGVRYRVLAIPPLEAASPDLLACVTRLRDAGATVVWPRKPVRAPGLTWGKDGDRQVRRLADALWARGVFAGVAEALAARGVAPDVTVVSNGARDVRKVAWLHRRDAEADWYFVAMPNREEATAVLSFRQAGREPELWDAETGAVAPADAWRETDGRTEVTVPFTVCGSKFVVFRRPAKKGTHVAACRIEARVAEPPPPLPVAGAWTVSFPNGFLPNRLAKGPDEKVAFDRLASWSENANPGVRYFSGIATYEKTLDGAAVAKLGATPGARVVLDLGDVRSFAEVTANGTTYPALWKPPFRVDVTDALVPGRPLALRIRVANLWANRLIGDDREHADDCTWRGSVKNGTKEIGITEIPQWVKEGRKSPTGRCTFTTWKHWDKDDELLPSGLLGPVYLRTIIPARLSDRPATCSWRCRTGP